MKIKLFLSLIIATTLVATAVGKTKKNNNVLDLKHSVTDSDIVYPESFETNTQKLLESWYIRNYTSADDNVGVDQNTSDEQIKYRLSVMPTIIEMPFNSVVRKYIDRYTQNGRAQVAAMLGLSNYYMPIFEQALEEEGLPLELKYLPIIESALDPNAVSRHGATGLWQFMLATAKGLGMEVNSLVDERRDPYISSKKAAHYLKKLYDTYSDWSLAIAAYNCGPGAVNKAIRRATGNNSSKVDFWTIYNYLSPETRGYVPAFIAANYVMTYYPNHNISPVLPTKPLVTDTIGVCRRIHFNQISKILDIPVDELRLLNPQFRADLIPGNAEKTYFIILPSQQIHAYIVSEDEIAAFEAEKYAMRDQVEPGDAPSDGVTEETDFSADSSQSLLASENESANNEVKTNTVNTGGKTIMHKVDAGETLASIAEKYSVSPDDIKQWNNLRRNSLRVGQQLRVVAPAGVSQTIADNSTYNDTRNQSYSNTASTSSSKGKNATKAKAREKKPRTQNHEVKSGENLTVIAKKYGVSVDELKKSNNIKGDMLHPGDKIKVPSAKGASKAKGKSSKGKKKRRR